MEPSPVLVSFGGEEGCCGLQHVRADWPRIVEINGEEVDLSTSSAIESQCDSLYGLVDVDTCLEDQPHSEVRHFTCSGDVELRAIGRPQPTVSNTPLCEASEQVGGLCRWFAKQEGLPLLEPSVIHGWS
jgi:hypothetical protein